MRHCIVLLIVGVLLSGCWAYPHYTEVEDGNVFGYYYEGATSLLDVPDAQAKQVMAQNIRDVKREENESWEDYEVRKRTARDDYIQTSQELQKGRSYESFAINYTRKTARLTITGQNNFHEEFDVRPGEKLPVSLPKGTYTFHWKVGNKTSSSTKVIAQENWRPAQVFYN